MSWKQRWTAAMKRRKALDEELRRAKLNNAELKRAQFAALFSRRGQVRIGSIPVPATKWGTMRPTRRWWQLWRRFHRGKVGPIGPHLDSLMQEKLLKRQVMLKVKEASSDESSYEGKELRDPGKHWRNSFISIMASIALSFGPSNLFRFPFEAVEFGSIFLVAYAEMILLLLQPLVYIEMVIGQFSQHGVRGFSRLHHFASGLSFAILFMCLFFVPYKNIVLGHTGSYAMSVTYSRPETCSNSWNKMPECIPYTEVRSSWGQRRRTQLKNGSILYYDGPFRTSRLSTELYFRQVILELTWHVQGSTYSWNTKIFIGLSVAYLVVFLSSYDLTSWLSMGLTVGSVLIPISVSALLVGQLLRPGSWEGIRAFGTPKWETLLETEIWYLAFRSAFATLGVGYGLFPRVASKNDFAFGYLYLTSWICCLTCVLFSVLSALIVYTELGIVRRAFQLPVDQIDKIFAEETGISFICVSGALLNLGHKWTMISFFWMFNVVGVWRQIVATETCTSYLISWLPHKRVPTRIQRIVALPIVIGIQFASALLFNLAGSYLLESSHFYSGAWAACFVVLTEIVTIVFFYGFNFFRVDIELMNPGARPPLIFQWQTKFLVPPLIVGSLVVLSFDMASHRRALYLGFKPAPTWTAVTGLILNLIPAAIFGLGAIVVKFRVDSDSKDWIPGDKRLELTYRRLLARRDAIDIEDQDRKHSTEELTTLEVAEICARRKALILQHRKLLTRFFRRKRAKYNWRSLCNQVNLARGRVRKLTRLVNRAITQNQAENYWEEAQYLCHLLGSLNIENILASAQVPDFFSSELEESNHILGVILTGIPAEGLSNVPQNAPLTTYDILCGNRSQSPEEAKLKIVIRVKKELGLPWYRDEKELQRISRDLDREAHLKSCFDEESLIDFTLKVNGYLLRILLLCGDDHSLLRSTPFPRPPVLRIFEEEVKHLESDEAVLRFITHAVLQDVRKSKNPRVDPHWREIIEASTEFGIGVKLYSPPEPLIDWFYRADPSPYNIDPRVTFYVVIYEKDDLDEMDPFRWIKKPSKAPRVPRPKFELVKSTEPLTYLTNLSTKAQETRLIAETRELNDVPREDLVYEEYPDLDFEADDYRTDNLSLDPDELERLRLEGWDPDPYISTPSESSSESESKFEGVVEENHNPTRRHHRIREPSIITSHDRDKNGRRTKRSPQTLHAVYPWLPQGHYSRNRVELVPKAQVLSVEKLFQETYSSSVINIHGDLQGVRSKGFRDLDPKNDFLNNSSSFEYEPSGRALTIIKPQDNTQH